jgi:hypothetical protein
MKKPMKTDRLKAALFFIIPFLVLSGLTAAGG